VPTVNVENPEKKGTGNGHTYTETPVETKHRTLSLDRT
jgi:hypothetical protein